MEAQQTKTAAAKDEKSFLGTGALVAYYITNLVGAGILVIPAIAQEAAGRWAVMAWLLLIACAWPLARVFAAIAIDYPNSNGVLHFIGQVAGRRMRDGLSLIFVLVMITGNPIMFMVGARYLIQGFGLEPSLLFPLSVLVMFSNVAFNLLGLRYSAWLQTGLTVLTLGVLFAALSLALPYTDTANLSIEPFDLTGFSLALGVCFFTFLGWENVCTIAPNVKDSAKSFRRAIAISVPLIGGIYLAVAIILALAVPSGGISGNYAVIDLLMSATGMEQATRGANLLGFMVVFLSANAWVLAAGKLVSSAARDQLLPVWLEHGSQSTPRRAFAVLAGCYIAVIAVVWRFQQTEAPIVALVSAGFLVVYIFTLAAAVWHYKNSSIRGLGLLSLALVLIFALSVWAQMLIALVFLAGILLYLTVSHKTAKQE